jgi:drug/metabolite transporter (DMT)-like permease
VSGAAWAAVSGALFGVFQALSAIVVRRAVNLTLATLVQLVTATVAVGVIAAATEGLDRLADAPARSLGMFALAGLIHFFVGWSALNRSQHRVGAARSAPLLATSPVFGLLVGLVVTGAWPGPVALLGIAVTMAGAYVITDPGAGRRVALADSGWGLTTAFAWGLSAVFTVEGLDGFSYPLLGVTVGLVAAAVPFAVLLCVGSAPVTWTDARADTGLKLLAGAVVAVATWWRWLSLETTSIGVVLALQLLSVPSVLIVAPLLARRGEEVVSARLAVGTAVVLVGALALILG